MRFGTASQPPPYMNRRHQRRMLGLVFALILVMVGIKLVSDPARWNWFFFLANGRREQSQSDSNGPSQLNPTSPHGDPNRLKDHEFILPPDDAESADESATGNHGDVVAQANAEETPETQDSDETDFGDEPSTVELPPALLDGIENFSLGIQAEEADSFFGILAHVRDVSQDDLQDAANAEITHAELMDGPETLRGQPVELKGNVHRIKYVPAIENSSGIEATWNIWLLTDDSGIDPYRVVFTEKPDFLPQSIDIEPNRFVPVSPPMHVKVAGYFFKIEGYNTEQGKHDAPVILAKKLRQFIPEYTPQVENVSGKLLPYLIGLGAIVGVVALISIWIISRGDKKFASGRLKELTTPPEDDIDALKSIEGVTVEETLQELSDEDQQAEEMNS